MFGYFCQIVVETNSAFLNDPPKIQHDIHLCNITVLLYFEPQEGKYRGTDQ